jgi:8-oxo-dGTP pyrophosphatase MutT (NUDIX family)
VKAIVGLVLASLVVLAGCYTGPGVDHYVGVLDTLDVPADWEVVATQRRGPGEEFDCDPLMNSTCPGADRWYALGGDVTAALEAARELVEAAGFIVDEVIYPACDGPPSGSACTLYASKNADKISASILPPGRNTGLDSPPDADVLIRITAQR